GAVVAYLLPGYGGMLVMAGMAGILSGAMRAPLTGTLFAIEVTGHFDLLPVALGAAVASYALSVLMMPRSIFTERLARRGHHIVQEFATDTLETTKAQQIMTTAPETLPVTMPMYQVIALMSDLHAHHHYPVVNAQGRFIAVVSRKEIIPLQLQQRSTQLTLQEFIGDEPQISAHADTLCSHIADYLFNEEMGMVVVTEAESGQVKGVITRHDIFRVRYLAKKAESHKVKYLRFRKPE
ncbi:CBS domain-containing protein, partial [Klebsiella pneumoniae]|uniref:CBS domain-containing protein n=2 Tax=Klebsiella/Raoultella group TaxID=2890311 RepID=UPI0039C0F7C4